MKLDKENLQKNRFWIMLGALAPLILFVLIYLFTGVASALNREKLAIEQLNVNLLAKKELTETMKELEALTEQEKKLIARKDEVWKKAWDLQQEMFVWPDAVRPLGDLYFGDPIDGTNRDAYIRENSYRAQYLELARMVEPVRFNGGWQKVLQHVPRWQVEKFGPPSSEEVWLAQEDYWVQRELMLAVVEANSSVSNFKKIDSDSKDQKPARGEIARQRFANPYWQVDLVLLTNADKKHVVRGKIKNIGKERQLLGKVFFRLWVSENLRSAPEDLAVQGEALGIGQEAELMFVEEKTRGPEKVVVKEFNPTGLYAFEQVLDITIAPIKRLDRVIIPYHANRTYDPKLKTPLFSKERAPVEKKGPDFLTGPVDAFGEKAGPRLAVYDSNKTDNGLERLRYMHVSPEVRRLPVGMLLVVDEAHIQDILKALANSKLRLEITAFDWYRHRKPIGEDKPEATKPGTTTPKPGTVPPPPKPGEKPGVATVPGKPAAEEPQASLVELAIYGIASLYEKHPPKEGPPPTAEKPPEKPKPEPAKDGASKFPPPPK